MEFLVEYGLFLAKSVTVLVAILITIAFVVGSSQRQKTDDTGHIEVKDLNDSLKAVTQSLKNVVLNAEAMKHDSKQEKKRQKELQKSQKKDAKTGVEGRHRLFVIDFKGDVQASEVTSLREEITAILSVATENDEVMVRLESPGGVVHGYGLAASQLQRIRNSGVALVVAVDKVAASGGYMMACVADKIIASPFAVLGSIGVVAQLPNFHRLLKKNDVDFEVLTAGEHKRTLTVFGENTDKGRQKFLEDLEDTHGLFKEYVSERRPDLDIQAVANGDIWFGKRALEVKLIDEIKTSDEYLIEACDRGDVVSVSFQRKRTLPEKLGLATSAALEHTVWKVLSAFRNQKIQ